MPVMDGIEAAQAIRRADGDACILMLTGSNSRTDVDRARQAGAAGYVTKDRIAAELIDAIVEIAARRSYPAADDQLPRRPPGPPRLRASSRSCSCTAGRDAGMGGMGFTPPSQGGTHIVERNLTRFTVVVGVLFFAEFDRPLPLLR